MRILFSLFFVSLSLFAKSYYSRVEPYEVRTVMSNVSGEVLDVRYDLLGKKLTNEVFVSVDAKLDKDELNVTLDKLEYLKKMVSLTKQNIKNIEDSLARKEQNYKNVQSLSVKSKVEKDREFYDLVNTRNLLTNTKKELLNQQTQLADLTLHVKRLQKRIDDKSFRSPSNVLLSLHVKRDQVVAPGVLVAKVADTSKALLSIYVSEEELKDIQNKKIYIDGKKTNYTIARYIPVADEKNISEYRVDIETDAPKLFSKLVKIEFKER